MEFHKKTSPAQQPHFTHTRPNRDEHSSAKQGPQSSANVGITKTAPTQRMQRAQLRTHQAAGPRESKGSPLRLRLS